MVEKNIQRKSCSVTHPTLFFFFSGASLSGWRWGKCARCATCPSCSSPSRLAAQSPLCQYSSHCPGLRTWCSRLGSPLLQYTTATHPITHTCTGTLWYESVDRPEKQELLRRFSEKNNNKRTVNLHLSYPCIGSQKGIADFSYDW